MSYYVTVEGFKKLEDQLRSYKKERPDIVKAIEVARGHGDLSENGDYDAAKERQAFVEGMIADLENKIANAVVIDTSKLDGDTVKFGATVTLVDENDKESTYQIVGESEVDVANGRISYLSPLGSILIGKTVGDYFELERPSGEIEYEITDIKFI